MKKPHFDPDRNVFIAGVTRGGKTVTGNSMHSQFDGLRIFWNPEEEENVVGYTCSQPRQILAAVDHYGWGVALDYRPQGESKKQKRAEIQMVKEMLFDLANATGRKHPIQVVVDECQEVSEQNKGSGGLHSLVKKGLKRQIKVVAMSQDPATVSKTIIRQCDYNLWCGGYNPYYEPYFNSYNLPTEKFKGQDQGEYVVLKKAEVVAEGLREPSRYA